MKAKSIREIQEAMGLPPFHTMWERREGFWDAWKAEIGADAFATESCLGRDTGRSIRSVVRTLAALSSGAQVTLVVHRGYVDRADPTDQSAWNGTLLEAIREWAPKLEIDLVKLHIRVQERGELILSDVDEPGEEA